MDHGRTIAQGTTRQLIELVGAEHIVEFAVTGRETSDVNVALLMAIPGVQSHSLDAGLHQLSVG